MKKIALVFVALAIAVTSIVAVPKSTFAGSKNTVSTCGVDESQSDLPFDGSRYDLGYIQFHQSGNTYYSQAFNATGKKHPLEIRAYTIYNGKKTLVSYDTGGSYSSYTDCTKVTLAKKTCLYVSGRIKIDKKWYSAHETVDCRD